MIWTNSNKKIQQPTLPINRLNNTQIALANQQATHAQTAMLMPIQHDQVELKPRSLLQRLFTKQQTGLQTISQPALDQQLALQQLHYEYVQREQQLQQQTLLLEQQQKRRQWLIPLALSGALAGGYMLFLLSNMQNAMFSMTGSIDNMNNHMAAMSSDTHVMSQNVQTMQGSIQQLNGNVAQMAGAVKPMHDMAETVNPLVQTFRKFIPF